MLGRELREMRERRGLSRAAAAARAGLSVEALKKIETNNVGRYPSMATLEALAECYRMNIIIGPDETVLEPLD